MTNFKVEAGTVSSIQYDTTAPPVDMTHNIKEPTVSDVLGLDDLSSENDDPFADMETPLVEVDRGEAKPADSLT